MVTPTLTMKVSIIMDDRVNLPSRPLLRLQSWLSPAFPNGAYSYSHGLEWAVEAGDIYNRGSLVDWLETDLCYGSGRNEAIFFRQAWRCTKKNDAAKLWEVAELAAAYRATSELALEGFQQGAACLATLCRAWPDRTILWLSEEFHERNIRPLTAIVLGVRSASQGIPYRLALPAFLQSYIANLVIAGIRLIPLGQTDGQIAVAELEEAVLFASAQAEKSTTDDLGSAALMVDFASMEHETQYTRLFRS